MRLILKQQEKELMLALTHLCGLGLISLAAEKQPNNDQKYENPSNNDQYPLAPVETVQFHCTVHLRAPQSMV